LCCVAWGCSLPLRLYSFLRHLLPSSSLRILFSHIPLSTVFFVSLFSIAGFLKIAPCLSLKERVSFLETGFYFISGKGRKDTYLHGSNRKGCSES
jgi:hypothetical protein